MPITYDQAEREYLEPPEFEDEECATEGCEEDAEEEFKNHWYCIECLDRLLSEGKNEK